MKGALFIVGFMLLLLTEIARVYFIMPFPGSQEADTIALAYWIQSNLGVLRLVGLGLIAWPLYHYYRSGSRNLKIGIGLLLVFYGVVFYLFNFKFLAEKMFYQPQEKLMVSAKDNRVPVHQLVLGITMGGEARAYPIEIIGYHHQVRDSIGGQPVMVTYCTVCRTGRVFSPSVGGKLENFRLVGMDHFNAMFEDSRTGSWWRQVNGEAIAGSLKGQKLPGIPSQQMSLESWIRLFPNTLIMQPDPHFQKEYEGLKNYDEGKSKGKLTRADSLSWKDKSWVVGVSMGMYARAYDWNDLKENHVMNDQLAGKPLVVMLEKDTVTFHTWSSLVGNDTLHFEYQDSTRAMIDLNTHSHWDESGKCVEGKWEGKQLELIQSYQEFWHSWRTFHPETSRYDYAKDNIRVKVNSTTISK